MTIKSWSIVALLMIGLAGCASVKRFRNDGLPRTEVTVEGRAAKVDAALNTAPIREVRYDVTSVELSVPRTLKVSEENLIYPHADIVWRGEPRGDRYAQVQAVVEEGLAAGVAAPKTGPKVVLAVQLERFHSLTEKARFTVGGVHDVVMIITVRGADTGEVLEGPRRVEVAIRAAGNDAALAEDAAGLTQRAVIVQGVAAAIRRELSVPAPTLPKP